MKQMTLAAAADQSGFERHRKPTRRDAFLAEMQSLVPWARLVALIEPHYPCSCCPMPSEQMGFCPQRLPHAAPEWDLLSPGRFPGTPHTLSLC